MPDDQVIYSERTRRIRYSAMIKEIIETPLTKDRTACSSLLLLAICVTQFMDERKDNSFTVRFDQTNKFLN